MNLHGALRQQLYRCEGSSDELAKPWFPFGYQLSKALFS